MDNLRKILVNFNVKILKLRRQEALESARRDLENTEKAREKSAQDADAAGIEILLNYISPAIHGKF
jgi:hypothetical protein